MVRDFQPVWLQAGVHPHSGQDSQLPGGKKAPNGVYGCVECSVLYSAEWIQKLVVNKPCTTICRSESVVVVIRYHKDDA